MKDGQELYNKLQEHSGCDGPYVHSLVKTFFYTPGVRDFAREAGGGAYWLLDILATEPAIRNHVMEMGFGLVELKVTGSKALLTVRNDDGDDPVFRQALSYTDCPEAPGSAAWKFYIAPTEVDNKTGMLCMLPKEY